MSERKIPIYLECGYSIAMQVLGGKWKICIIEALRDKPLRPSLIFKEVPDATERVINQQLKELLEYKIIDRKIYAEQPPRTEYFLTDLGRSAFPILDALGRNGARKIESSMRSCLMLKMKTKWTLNKKQCLYIQRIYRHYFYR